LADSRPLTLFYINFQSFGSLNVPGVDFNVENVDKNFVGTFRRLSAAFEAMEAAEREANENSSDDEVRKKSEIS
jgi:hypothetical protein